MDHSYMRYFDFMLLIYILGKCSTYILAYKDHMSNIYVIYTGDYDLIHRSDL